MNRNELNRMSKLLTLLCAIVNSNKKQNLGQKPKYLLMAIFAVFFQQLAAVYTRTGSTKNGKLGGLSSRGLNIVNLCNIAIGRK